MCTYKYRLVIFDADKTLTPFRDGSCGAFSFTLLPGVKEKCEELRANGVRLGIASNQSADRAEQDIVRQLAWTANEIVAEYGGVVYTQNKATQKPSPVMLLRLMGGSRLDVAPSETLFVGDQETDRQAAEAAGIDFMWAKDFFNFSEKGD
jgi:HAD superfamily hydrolase (TIGR01662 family)